MLSTFLFIVSFVLLVALAIAFILSVYGVGLSYEDRVSRRTDNENGIL